MKGLHFSTFLCMMSKVMLILETGVSLFSYCAWLLFNADLSIIKITMVPSFVFKWQFFSNNSALLFFLDSHCSQYYPCHSLNIDYLEIFLSATFKFTLTQSLRRWTKCKQIICQTEIFMPCSPVSNRSSLLSETF